MNVISMVEFRGRQHARLEDSARKSFIERDFHQALRQVRRCLPFEPRCWQAHVLHGDILCALGREGEALVCYHRARRLSPARAEPYWSVSTVHFLACRWEQALRYLDLAQEKLQRGDGPLWEWVAEDRAVALNHLGRQKEALAALRWGLRRRPRGERLLELRSEMMSASRSPRPVRLRPVP
ncbi:MAG TPA: hypothetical protein VGK67_11260 [Myxococcales bacterium]|jgi:Flp pilus assembly protein TadD